jgi:hypothetical protein
MKGFVCVTDNDWSEFLSQQSGIDEVDFWQPGRIFILDKSPSCLAVIRIFLLDTSVVSIFYGRASRDY